MTAIKEILDSQAGNLEEDLFRNFFNLPLVGAAITSREKGWVEANDRTCEILGYPREELFKKDWAEITHPDDLAADVALFQKMLAGEINGYSIEKRFIRGDGTIVWTILSGGKSNTTEAKKEYFYVQILDISERKQVEFDLIKARNDAERARKALQQAHEELQKYAQYEIEQSRFKEREQLLQDMHDGFGSQLASIKIMAERGNINPQKLPEYLDELTQDLHLVVDTLGRSTASTIKNAFSDMQYRLQRRLHSGPPFIHWEIDLENVERIKDRSVLHILRIVQEAINNALRHSKSENIWIKARYQHEKKKLEVSVIDQGVGMPEQLQRGRGTGNMHRRAREIGAKLEWNNQCPGTEVRISLILD